MHWDGICCRFESFWEGWFRSKSNDRPGRSHYFMLITYECGPLQIVTCNWFGCLSSVCWPLFAHSFAIDGATSYASSSRLLQAHSATFLPSMLSSDCFRMDSNLIGNKWEIGFLLCLAPGTQFRPLFWWCFGHCKSLFWAEWSLKCFCLQNLCTRFWKLLLLL